MLSRDQVLHVARLARLEVTPEEVERFGGELSQVLDYIELIAELGDLEDVPPTSHVIDVENALREDVPRPSMPVEKALESAPDAANGGFRAPAVSLSLTVARAARALGGSSQDVQPAPTA
jgi:aspartyl-tRNA(Asn)/glutamyl-tRNA(Gln) amidotransferase subunit C